jgi:DNA-binding NarL/FixJ family response regulator
MMNAMSQPAVIRVGVVEDNATLREGMVMLLNGSPGFTCAGAYGSAEEALVALPAVTPHVVLMDINLPKASGIECVRRLKTLLPGAQMLMFTVHEDGEQVFDALAAGAAGYLVKRTPPAKILEAIEDVMKGGSPMSGQVARLVVQSFQKMGPSVNTTENLTNREQEVLALLAKGYRYKEIAETLFISPETVRGHLRHVYEKLHVRSRSEAILKYLGH